MSSSKGNKNESVPTQFYDEVVFLVFDENLFHIKRNFSQMLHNQTPTMNLDNREQLFVVYCSFNRQC
ncbi:unnamed protein product [Schistosoma margrebowiei]|uniref:Uncharacterized protein n=1 Tax=Schistosoma margrebowiei TaxID=48269 RepID=A0A3P8H0G5_9TREM|nr:unnamed protein product [Schistosoma margrebowiei]